MIDDLENLLNSNYKVKRRGGNYILTEFQEKDFPETILKAQGKHLLYKFDNDPYLLNIFENIKGAKRLADYICFYEHKSILNVFIIELSMKKWKTKQKKTTINLSDYVINNLNTIFGSNVKPVFKYICLTQKGIPKFTTKPKDRSDYFLKAGDELNITYFCSLP